jgi:hypothetical protein
VLRPRLEAGTSRIQDKTITARVMLFGFLSKKLRKTVILPVVFYGFETWSPSLRERELRVFEGRGMEEGVWI